MEEQPASIATSLPSSTFDIVLDANAFLGSGSASLLTLCSTARTVYTVANVLNEIRDGHARQRLAALPFEIKTAVPSPEALKRVVDFARKTGDAAVLSKTDVLVIALTQTLNHHIVAELDDQPHKDQDESMKSHTTAPPASRPVDPNLSWAAVLGGAHAISDHDDDDDKEGENDDDADSDGSNEDELEEANNDDDDQPVPSMDDFPDLPSSVPFPHIAAVVSPPPQPIPVSRPIITPPSPPKTTAAAPPPSSVPRESRILAFNALAPAVMTQDDDNDHHNTWARPGGSSNGWGTALRSSRTDAAFPITSTTTIPVLCVTSDYAMQNVLLRMTLPILAPDGRRVTQVRSWVWKCDTCMKISPMDPDRKFCSSCGKPTLGRLAYSIDAKGRLRYHYSKTRRPQTRGVRYAIGKNSNLLLREDQLLSGKWSQLSRRKKNATSMFGQDVNEMLSISTVTNNDVKVGFGNTNPNAKKGRERRGAQKRKS